MKSRIGLEYKHQCQTCGRRFYTSESYDKHLSLKKHEYQIKGQKYKKRSI
jgi:uncharacterized C2H2 Zn-finger protein